MKLKERIHEIIEASAAYFSVSTKSIYSRSRKREVVLARHMAMYWSVKKFLGKTIYEGYISVVKIAECFNRDHTTILYAVGVCEDFSEIYPDFAEKLNGVGGLLKEDFSEVKFRCSCGDLIRYSELEMCNDCFCEQYVNQKAMPMM